MLSTGALCFTKRRKNHNNRVVCATTTRPVAVGTLQWRDAPGCGARGWWIDRAGGWTAFVGPTLASSRGRIVDVMSPCDWPKCVWIFWPLLEAIVRLDFSLIVLRIVWRDLAFRITGGLLWPAPIGGRATGSRGSLSSAYVCSISP